MRYALVFYCMKRLVCRSTLTIHNEYDYILRTYSKFFLFLLICYSMIEIVLYLADSAQFEV
jgi:hypothetical protein